LVFIVCLQNIFWAQQNLGSTASDFPCGYRVVLLNLVNANMIATERFFFWNFALFCVELPSLIFRVFDFQKPNKRAAKSAQGRGKLPTNV